MADIEFKPLTDGLGFHPFENGLPYAPGPHSKHPSTLSSGSGAVSAGRPVFSFPIYDPAMAPRPVPARPIVETNPAPSPAREALPARDNSVDARGMGYVFKRSFAYLVDTLIHGTLGAGALVSGIWKQDIQLESLATPGVLLLIGGFLLAFNWTMMLAEEVALGTTVGKRLMGLTLMSTQGRPSVSRVLLRAVLFCFSMAFCGLGLLSSLFDSKKRCWHDLASGIEPQETARL